MGSSGLRLAWLVPGQEPHEEQTAYPGRFEDPQSWRSGLITLVQRLSGAQRQRVGAISLDGTSGTLLLCRPDGQLLHGELALALPYSLACPEQKETLRALGLAGAAASLSGSAARALRLLERARAGGEAGPLWLRHQADWLMGWLLGDWRWGEEGNNLRLGWDLHQGTWGGRLAAQPWREALPQIRASGEILGSLAAEAAEALGLPPSCRVVAGSTDANAAVLAADPADGDGISVLGTTLVLKQFVPGPIEGPGVSCHRVAGRWLAGGASNGGAGLLLRFFTPDQLEELSRQIDPDHPTGLQLRPIPTRGERFPWDDPTLEPVLEPRPVSDALYLQALLEGLTALEKAGWERLRQLGAPPLRRVITVGGGARNPQWRALRQRALGLPVLNRPQRSACQGMALLAVRALAPGRMAADTDPTPEPR
ncbi:MAG: FGGY-family carbohydrate kinase [Synechococcaceae cyanobacterium]|nr:FGGY-family carbohydrate kinase [Synechococcaceae cyanobacterium]